LRLMDLPVDMKHRLRDLPARAPLAPDRSVRLGTPADVSAMRAMTRGAFNLTRFGVDPFFTQTQIDDFYATWATNLFTGLADAVLVAEVDGQLAGFVAAKRLASGQGRIPLVATASAFQRRGVARDLLAHTLGWFVDAGCTAAFVKTQATNYPAVALYERAGFTLDHAELTFTITTTLIQE
jgi:ribosomal protein S18 acetylase RimI-like enzyme